MNPISLDEIEQARRRIADSTLRSPLVHLGADDAPADIYLKLENLQPTGSFKARGAEMRSPYYLIKSETKECILVAQATWHKLSLGMHVETESHVLLSCLIPLQRRSWRQSRGLVQGSSSCREMNSGRSLQRIAMPL
jgi:threonine dehydratase